MSEISSFKIKNSKINMEINEEVMRYKNNKKQKHPLVSELWAIRGKCDELKAKRIAKKSLKT